MISFNLTSQTVRLSVYSEISIITVGPGDDLYSTFGHTAIRIKDPMLRLDLVYNYGMFDFNQPNFYLNFTRGKLLYKLGAYPFKSFLLQNRREKRWMKEQVLNINQQERQDIFEYLNENVRPQNASYLYDPFSNNCATKPIDILQNQLQETDFNTSFVSPEDSKRRLMNRELHQNTWSSIGINIALGSSIDKAMSWRDYLYLPNYVYYTLQNASYGKEKIKPLLKRENQLLDFNEIKEEGSFLVRPLSLFLLLLVIGILLTWKGNRNNYLKLWFDRLLFGITAFLGLLILFLWFFTNHATTPGNWNLLWTSPFLILFLFSNRDKIIHKVSIIASILLLLIIPIVWLLRIQEFNVYLIPLFALLLIRLLENLRLLSAKH